jgi:hypothetical protein
MMLLETRLLARGCGRQNKAWGGAEGGAPGMWRKRASSPRSGRQLIGYRPLRELWVFITAPLDWEMTITTKSVSPNKIEIWPKEKY